MQVPRNSDSSIQDWPAGGFGSSYDGLIDPNEPPSPWRLPDDSAEDQVQFSPLLPSQDHPLENEDNRLSNAFDKSEPLELEPIPVQPTSPMHPRSLMQSRAEVGNASPPAQAEAKIEFSEAAESAETDELESPRSSWLGAHFGGRSDNSLAFLSSLVAHLLLFILLACLVVTPEMSGKELTLQADVIPGQNADLVELSEFDIAPESNDADLEPEVQISEPELDIDMATDDFLNDREPVGSDPGVSASSASSKAAEQLNVADTGGGASFFGTYASGSEFVFVLDSSSSMKGERWMYACDELIRSLNQLSPGQSFLVICFDQRSKFLFNKVKYQSRNEEDITIRVRRWLRSIELGRETKPAHALKVALSLNPDAIFLLSDGELQDASVQMLRRKNSWKSEERQIPVHTVHLFSLVGKQTLEVIASENGGEFRSVK